MKCNAQLGRVGGLAGSFLAHQDTGGFNVVSFGGECEGVPNSSETAPRIVVISRGPVVEASDARPGSKKITY
jgi:hypothetical protein